METYELGNKNGQPFIRCRVCRLASFHADDIKNRYCANCHQFHDALEIAMLECGRWRSVEFTGTARR